MEGSFKNIKFKSVEEFLEFLPDDELKIVKFLRKIVFDSLPHITEKISYNVPFYKMNKGLFFIWPSSVKWGKGQSWTGVRFGFQKGYLLSDEINYLDKGERKYIFWKNFSSVKDIDPDLLKSYIFEAALIDQEIKKKK